MLISIVITVRNEARNIRDLLDSLVIQEGPIEIIILDAYSDDGTYEIAKKYAEKYDYIRVYLYGGTRGNARNYGVEKAKGEVVAFIDGDCIANPFWLKSFRKELENFDIVAGKTINIGYHAFETLERVELFHMGYDVTFPSCNLAYKKRVFQEINGFDPWFVTAEDIDLNYRAVSKGYKIGYTEDGLVYHRTRGSFYGFFKQAFWNGAGRKQLTQKHGALWGNYKPGDMFRKQVTLFSLFRLSMAMLGYIGYKIFGTDEYRKEDTDGK